MFALLINVMEPTELPLCSATSDTVPAGSPLTVRVTVPELPLTVAVILAGVPSWGASATEEESDRLKVPGPPELLPLLHPVIAKPRAARQQYTIRQEVVLEWFIPVPESTKCSLITLRPVGKVLA